MIGRWFPQDRKTNPITSGAAPDPGETNFPKKGLPPKRRQALFFVKQEVVSSSFLSFFLKNIEQEQNSILKTALERTKKTDQSQIKQEEKRRGGEAGKRGSARRSDPFQNRDFDTIGPKKAENGAKISDLTQNASDSTIYRAGENMLQYIREALCGIPENKRTERYGETP